MSEEGSWAVDYWVNFDKWLSEADLRMQARFKEVGHQITFDEIDLILEEERAEAEKDDER